MLIICVERKSNKSNRIALNIIFSPIRLVNFCQSLVLRNLKNVIKKRKLAKFIINAQKIEYIASFKLFI